jgi:signal transduction histidine kinase
MDIAQVNQLTVYFVLTLFFLVIILFSLFFIFNKRRLHYISEKQNALDRYQKELEASRIENQEHLLKALSWELHDNIGQLLSVSNLQLSMVSADIPEKDKKLVTDTREILSRVLEDVRNLSKSLNADSFMFLGLIKAVDFEIERLNRLKFVDATFITEGNETTLPDEHEIILFRIIQECISNVIKHARATKFEIFFRFGSEGFTILCEDNGIGMNIHSKNFGLGMKNIISRAALIGAEASLEPVTGGGLRVKIFYPVVNN